jgi:hypothetical protein
MESTIPSKKLVEQDYTNAASLLKCEIAAVKTVKEVESKGTGFLPTGEPIILFERHIFHRLTEGKYSKQCPDISNIKPGGYGSISKQHNRLSKAATLDRNAALQSASWGLFQCMGFNFSVCGYKTIQSFITAMYRNEGEHLTAFCNFVINNHLNDELQRKDWIGFARGYNGGNYRINKYDEKLAKAYIKFKAV